ncbi:hypothetical protein WA026_008699 [Henosepilachna vigintioctopunctata]|uniref:Kazal-like domain-containing protein n=1 Tax=Henosepilachna vigintioctopunctata TaxID=420089 RepID=A0AAW1VB05_9CUCU
MIHPSFLFRSDSRSRQFSAPVNQHGDEENDWGISIFPCLAAVFNWRTFGKPSVFVAILSLIGCAQGLLLFYFRNTCELWSKQYNIPKETVDWLLHSDGFFLGIIALPISYLATVSHRIVLISFITIFHGVFSMLLFIPERFLAKSVIVSNSIVQLCGESYTKIDEDINYGMVAIVVIYQFIFAASYIGYCSIGLVYIDDNAGRTRAVVLAIAIASREFGQQLGIYASWIPMYLKNPDIFHSLIWQGTSLFCIILGIAIAMFPKILPSLLIKKLAASLIELANGISLDEKISKENSLGFLATMKRVLSSRIVLLNVISTVAVQSALKNFFFFENQFKQSRFFISDGFDKSGYNHSFSLNFASNIMEQPFSMLCVLALGFAVSRFQTKIKYLVLWNIFIFALTSLLFSSYLFVRCGNEDMEHIVPTCSVDCGCSLEGTFNPVCLKDRTYFSPCHAGCHTTERIDDHEVYNNCSCTLSEEVAIGGTCQAEECNLVYQLTQVNVTIAEGLIASTILTSILILLGSVKKTDKALAFGFQLTFLNLVASLPVRWFYAHVSEQLCQQWYNGKCRLYSTSFSIFLTHATVMLLIVGTIAQFLLLCCNFDNTSLKKNIRKNSDTPSIVNPSDDEADMDELCRSIVVPPLNNEAGCSHSNTMPY